MKKPARRKPLEKKMDSTGLRQLSGEEIAKATGGNGGLTSTDRLGNGNNPA